MTAPKTPSTPKPILVGTDFSSGSDEALDVAIEQARHSGASLEIVHVVELVDDYPYGPIYFDYDAEAFTANANRELSMRVERAAAAGVTARAGLLEGHSPKEIVRRAREIGAALIVVGTHGRTGLAHAILGSVAENVVRLATCPVLTVPYPKKAVA